MPFFVLINHWHFLEAFQFHTFVKKSNFKCFILVLQWFSDKPYAFQSHLFRDEQRKALTILHASSQSEMSLMWHINIILRWLATHNHVISQMLQFDYNQICKHFKIHWIEPGRTNSIEVLWKNISTRFSKEYLVTMMYCDHVSLFPGGRVLSDISLSQTKTDPCSNCFWSENLMSSEFLS